MSQRSDEIRNKYIQNPPEGMTADDIRKMDVWPVGQAGKTEASHAFNIGSIPVRVTIL